MRRGFAIFLAFVLFIILLVVLFGHGHKKPNQVTGPTILPLPDYANTDAAVSITTDGIVNGDELHRQIRITIGETSRNLEVIQGYNGTVIDSHTFENNNSAYDVFLRSINNSGFLVKIKKTKAPSDERGQCALGFRYIFDLSNEGEDLSRLWSSSCSIGNWGGNLAAVRALFQDQIPNYQTLAGNVNLEATSTQ
jgi:hypothetical protein